MRRGLGLQWSTAVCRGVIPLAAGDGHRLALAAMSGSVAAITRNQYEGDRTGTPCARSRERGRGCFEVGVATLLSSGLARRANAVRGRSSRDTGARTANERAVRLSRAGDARGVSGHHQLHSAAARSLSRIRLAPCGRRALTSSLSRVPTSYTCFRAWDITRRSPWRACAPMSADSRVRSGGASPATPPARPSLAAV